MRGGSGDALRLRLQNLQISLCQRDDRIHLLLTFHKGCPHISIILVEERPPMPSIGDPIINNEVDYRHFYAVFHGDEMCRSE